MQCQLIEFRATLPAVSDSMSSCKTPKVWMIYLSSRWFEIRNWIVHLHAVTWKTLLFPRNPGSHGTTGGNCGQIKHGVVCMLLPKTLHVTVHGSQLLNVSSSAFNVNAGSVGV